VHLLPQGNEGPDRWSCWVQQTASVVWALVGCVCMCVVVWVVVGSVYLCVVVWVVEGCGGLCVSVWLC
jgi:hypothetical protein